MLQSKDINKISELKNGFTHRWREPDFIRDFESRDRVPYKHTTVEDHLHSTHQFVSE